MNEIPGMTIPLSDEEIEELDEFLISEFVCDDAMDVSTLDGFFAALISGPSVVMPSDALRWVWDEARGEREPAFQSTEQARHIFSLIMRHWNDVAHCLASHDDVYAPLTMENTSGKRTVPVIDEWCWGYWRGIELSRDAWQPLFDLHADWLEVIRLYGTEAGWKDLKKKRYSLDRHDAFARSLGPLSTRIYEFWGDARRRSPISAGPLAFGAAVSPRRAPPKVGRNDPCPCGSGKKYKKCHGEGGGDASVEPRSAKPAGPAANALPDRVESPLSRRVTRDSIEVSVDIYGDGKHRWLLEVVDEFHNSTVWDVSFPTDTAAWEAFTRAIETDGMASLVGPPPGGVTRH